MTHEASVSSKPARMRTRGVTIATVAISVLLAAAFLMAGGSKLAAAEPHPENFARWGYPAVFLYLVGATEVAAALLLVVPRTSTHGGLLLVALMIGAVGTHLLNGEAAMITAPLVLGALAAFVAYQRRAVAFWLGARWSSVRTPASGH